jgi:putative membrane protein
LGTVAAFMLTVRFVPGLSITGGWETTLLVALVWSVIITVIRPILAILTFPITLITFGLFSIVLNTLLFWSLTYIVPGFTIAGLWPAFFGVIVLSILTWIIHAAL